MRSKAIGGLCALLGTLALSSAGWAQNEPVATMRRAAPSADTAAPIAPPPPSAAVAAPAPGAGGMKLPQGRLLSLGFTGGAGIFLDLNYLVRLGARNNLQFYLVFDPPVGPVDPKTSQMVQRLQLDCSVRTMTVLGSVAYSAGGVALHTNPAAEAKPIIAGTIPDTAANFICDGVRPPGVELSNRGSALATTRAFLQSKRPTRQ